jgi:hypothetical protein
MADGVGPSARRVVQAEVGPLKAEKFQTGRLNKKTYVNLTDSLGLDSPMKIKVSANKTKGTIPVKVLVGGKTEIVYVKAKKLAKLGVSTAQVEGIRGGDFPEDKKASLISELIGIKVQSFREESKAVSTAVSGNLRQDGVSDADINKISDFVTAKRLGGGNSLGKAGDKFSKKTNPIARSVTLTATGFYVHTKGVLGKGAESTVKTAVRVFQEGAHFQASSSARGVRPIKTRDFEASKKEQDIVAQFKGNPNVVQHHDVSVHRSSKGHKKQATFQKRYAKGDMTSTFKADVYNKTDVRIKAMRDNANGLRSLHAKQVIHRDIKLDNIFVDEQGTHAVGDFGSAFKDGEQASLQSTVGSPGYVPPEACLGSYVPSKAGDVWAMGIVFIQMKAGMKGVAFRQILGKDGFNNELLKALADGDASAQADFNDILDEALPDRHKPGSEDRMIADMLKVVPEQRITMDQVCARLAHMFA